MVVPEGVLGVTLQCPETDPDQATRIARRMVGRWGMSPAVGPLSVLPDGRRGR